MIFGYDLAYIGADTALFAAAALIGFTLLMLSMLSREFTQQLFGKDKNADPPWISAPMVAFGFMVFGCIGLVFQQMTNNVVVGTILGLCSTVLFTLAMRTYVLVPQARESHATAKTVTMHSYDNKLCTVTQVIPRDGQGQGQITVTSRSGRQVDCQQ